MKKPVMGKVSYRITSLVCDALGEFLGHSYQTKTYQEMIYAQATAPTDRITSLPAQKATHGAGDDNLLPCKRRSRRVCSDTPSFSATKRGLFRWPHRNYCGVASPGIAQKLKQLGQALFGFCLLVGGTTGGSASEWTPEIEQLIRESTQKMQPYVQDAKKLANDAQEKLSALFQQEPGKISEQTTCSGYSGRSTEAEHGATSSKYLIFISLSMPEASLKALHQEAGRYGATLILRGLKNNSFKETAAQLQYLGISAEMNPPLFEQFKINQVPTFVWDKKPEPLIVSGNVSLAYALEQFEKAQ